MPNVLIDVRLCRSFQAFPKMKGTFASEVQSSCGLPGLSSVNFDRLVVVGPSQAREDVSARQLLLKGLTTPLRLLWMTICRTICVTLSRCVRLVAHKMVHLGF